MKNAKIHKFKWDIFGEFQTIFFVFKNFDFAYCVLSHKFKETQINSMHWNALLQDSHFAVFESSKNMPCKYGHFDVVKRIARTDRDIVWDILRYFWDIFKETYLRHFWNIFGHFFNETFFETFLGQMQRDILWDIFEIFLGHFQQHILWDIF